MKTQKAGGDLHSDWKIVERYQRGDRKAGDAMLRRHEGMLCKLARRYPHHFDEDLMQEARMGFLDGLMRARHGHGTAPASYAFWWARSYITKYVLDSGTVRVPISAQKGRLKYPGRVHLKTYFVDVDDSDENLQLVDPSSRLDSDEAMESGLDQHKMKVIRTLLPKLTPNERFVIRKRFLVDECLGLRELGDELGCSGENIRLIQNRAIAKLIKLCAAVLEKL